MIEILKDKNEKREIFMSVKNYKNKIDRLCAEYNKIKFRGIYIVLFMLYTFFWSPG